MTDCVLSDPPSDAPAPSEVSFRDGAALALFGHNLRAALSDVVGGLRLVAPEALDQLTRIQLDRVRVSAEGLAQLLDRGLAELLGEGPAIQPAHLNLQRFLTDIDLRWSGRALETGTGFALQRAADLPGGLQVDRVTLDRVVSNLLGNAFKYAGRGQVVCEVLRRADGGLQLAVRDDGPGFPHPVPDGLPVFQTRPPGRVQPGSGMGLRIVADLVQRIGGRLTLHNLPQGGAEALVDLPQSLSDPEEPNEDGLGPLLAGRRVLVADDNPTGQMIVSRLLAGLGADVMVVGDGVAAVGRLEREGFDLLIVDVEMPRLSGLDVIRCLRRMPGWAGRMPVIAVTAYGLPSDRRAVLAVGADEVLVKPLLGPHAFANAVRAVMDRAAPPPTTPIPPAVRPVAVPVSVFGEDRLPRLLEMAGPETGRDLLDRLIGDLQGVRRGLIDASAMPDWPAIRSHSHVLISLAGAVGGLTLQAGAETLNQVANRLDGPALDSLLPVVLVDLAAMIAGVEQVRRDFSAANA